MTWPPTSYSCSGGQPRMLRSGKGRKTNKALGGHVGRGEAAGLLARVDDQPGGAVLRPGLAVSAPHEGWLVGLLLLMGERQRRGSHTTWWRRFAAPRPVGPAPMIRTSTLLHSGVSRGQLGVPAARRRGRRTYRRPWSRGCLGDDRPELELEILDEQSRAVRGRERRMQRTKLHRAHREAGVVLGTLQRDRQLVKWQTGRWAGLSDRLSFFIEVLEV